MVSGVTFRPLIHFEFIAIYNVRKYSNIIFLQVAVMCTCVCVYTYNGISLSHKIYVCVCVCVYIHTYIHTYIYIYMTSLVALVVKNPPVNGGDIRNEV